MKKNFGSYSVFVFFVFFGVLVTPNQDLQGKVRHDKFVVLTPPKAGTHLLTKVIGLILGKKSYHYPHLVEKPSTMMSLVEKWEKKHYFFDNHTVTPEIIKELKHKNYKIITIMRDPRDQLLSILNWSLSGKWGTFRPKLPLAKLSKEEQIDELTLGERYGWQALEGCYKDSCDLFLLRSLPSSFVYVARFESLVGPQGGGSLDEQVLEIINIAAHLNVPMTVKKAKDIAKKTFGGTSTFHKGVIGSWKSCFTEQNKENYKVTYGELLIDWGYEADLDW